MWQVVNHTPYAAERTWVQDRDANKLWLVVVKATFDILGDGSTRLAPQQRPVLRMAEPRGEFGRSSLLRESDLAGVKPGTDVLVDGHAWAPGGKAVSSLDVGIAVGPVRKLLRVSGDRLWERGPLGGLSPTGPQRFERMPLTYERAYGGWDRSAADPAQHRMDGRNPVGTGFGCSAGGLAQVALPNVEYPDQLVQSWRDRPAPAGFGPVDCAWSPRRELAGTYDDAWRRERAPLWAADFDARYHQCAPADQQVSGFLRGGETVSLLNLSPQGTLAFRLPRVYPFFETRFGRERVEHRAQLCTVAIEPDAACVTLAWQTSLVCNDRVDELDATVVTEKQVL